MRKILGSQVELVCYSYLLPLFKSKFVENGCQGDKVVEYLLLADLHIQVSSVKRHQLPQILQMKKFWKSKFAIH
jgi:hypothetical protein